MKYSLARAISRFNHAIAPFNVQKFNVQGHENAFKSFKPFNRCAPTLNL
jgi:hypothetical protein